MGKKPVCMLVYSPPSFSLAPPPPHPPTRHLPFSPSLPLMYSALCNGWVTRWTPEGEGRPGHAACIFLPLSSSLLHSVFLQILTYSFSSDLHTVATANKGANLYTIVISLFLKHTTLPPMLTNYTVDLSVCVLKRKRVGAPSPGSFCVSH